MLPCPGFEISECYVSEIIQLTNLLVILEECLGQIKMNIEYRKIDFYDRKDKLLKTLVFSDYKQYLRKFWNAHTLKMVNHNTGKETDISVKETNIKQV